MTHSAYALEESTARPHGAQAGISPAPEARADVASSLCAVALVTAVLLGVNLLAVGLGVVLLALGAGPPF